MAKFQNDLMLDAAFDWLRARVTQMVVCSAQPTSYTEATTTSNYKLADVAMTSTALTISDGDTNGRKVRMQAKSSVTVDKTGTANHVALVGSTGSTLLLVTTCTTVALTSGGTVDIPVWDDEIADAA